MHFVAICPTYRRPACLASVVAMWERQLGLSEISCELLILDDGGDFAPEDHSRDSHRKWKLISSPSRFESLPQKFNHLVQLAGDAGHSNTWVLLWEDDDVYGCRHLQVFAEAAKRAEAAKKSRHVWLHPKRCIMAHAGQSPFEEVALARFHAQWAFPFELWREIGGYPDVDPAFDSAFGQRLSTGCVGESLGRAWWLNGPVCPFELVGCRPTYAYRWGNAGFYHGSAYGPGFYQRVGELAARHEPRLRCGTSLRPKLDMVSRSLLKILD